MAFKTDTIGQEAIVILVDWKLYASRGSIPYRLSTF